MTVKFQKSTNRTDVIVVEENEAALRRIGYALGEMETTDVIIKPVPGTEDSYYIRRPAKEGIQTDLIQFSVQNKVANLLRWANKWEVHPALNIARKQAGEGQDVLPKHAIFAAEKAGKDVVVITQNPDAAKLMVDVARAWAATGYPKTEEAMNLIKFASDNLKGGE